MGAACGAGVDHRAHRLVGGAHGALEIELGQRPGRGSPRSLASSEPVGEGWNSPLPRPSPTSAIASPSCDEAQPPGALGVGQPPHHPDTGVGKMGPDGASL